MENVQFGRAEFGERRVPEVPKLGMPNGRKAGCGERGFSQSTEVGPRPPSLPSGFHLEEAEFGARAGKGMEGRNGRSRRAEDGTRRPPTTRGHRCPRSRSAGMLNWGVGAHLRPAARPGAALTAPGRGVGGHSPGGARGASPFWGGVSLMPAVPPPPALRCAPSRTAPPLERRPPPAPPAAFFPFAFPAFSVGVFFFLSFPHFSPFFHEGTPRAVPGGRRRSL